MEYRFRRLLLLRGNRSPWRWGVCARRRDFTWLRTPHASPVCHSYWRGGRFVIERTQNIFVREKYRGANRRGGFFGRRGEGQKENSWGEASWWLLSTSVWSTRYLWP